MVVAVAAKRELYGTEEEELSSDFASFKYTTTTIVIKVIERQAEQQTVAYTKARLVVGMDEWLLHVYSLRTKISQFIRN